MRKWLAVPSRQVRIRSALARLSSPMLKIVLWVESNVVGNTQAEKVLAAVFDATAGVSTTTLSDVPLKLRAIQISP
jgi:hypothetical protein